MPIGQDMPFGPMPQHPSGFCIRKILLVLPLPEIVAARPLAVRGDEDQAVVLGKPLVVLQVQRRQR